MARTRSEIGDFCVKGHKIEGDNVHWRKHNGTMYLRCFICTKAKEERHKEKRNEVRKEKTRAERYDKILSGELDGTAKYTGLNYLKLGKRAQKAWEPLEEAFDRTQSKCYDNPMPYVDYADEFPPDKDFAYELCKGCPMLVECGRFAAAYKPAVGVWAGEVWKDGSVYK